MSSKIPLQLLITAVGGGKTVAELLAIQKAVDKTAAEADGIKALANSLGLTYKQAQRLAQGMGLSADKAAVAVQELRELQAVGADTATRFQALTGKLALTAEQFQKLDRAAKQSGEGQRQTTSLLGGGIAELAFKLNNVVAAYQTLAAAAQPAYAALISSNEQLNAQLLSSQTNLASATRIFEGGLEITDPTEKIKASQGQLRAALKQIEKDTQSLVGVTSSEVNELFQITLTNAAALNNQSKEFPNAIQAATSLTKGWAASLKVVGVPLDQARQEINSILKGQVDQNSILAKNLNITNEQVRQWQSQGRLVDELNKRLDVFVAGNAIAARSVDGISSNIKDVFERIARNTGEPLLEPIINALAQVEKYLKDNEAGLTQFFSEIARQAATLGTELAQAFVGGYQAIEGAVKALSPIVSEIFTIVQIGAIGAARLLNPLVVVVGKILEKAAEGYDKLLRSILLLQTLDAQEALDAYSEQTLAAADAVLKLSTEINKQRAAGGSVTPQQIERAKAQKEAIEGQIAAYKSLNAITPEIAAQRDQSIKQLEALRDRLEKATGGITLEAKELETLGDTYTQLQKRVEDAQRSIANQGNGDSEQFKKAAKELIDTTKQQVEIRQLDVESAAARLRELQNNTKLEVDTQIAAKETIEKIYQQRAASLRENIELGRTSADESIRELEKIRDNRDLELETRRKAADEIAKIRKDSLGDEIAAIQTAQAEIEALQKQGNLSEAAADRQLTQLKLEEFAKRSNAARIAARTAFADKDRQAALEEERKYQADIDKLKADYLQRAEKREGEVYDRQRTQIQSLYQQGLIDRQTYNQSLLDNDLAQNDFSIRQQLEYLARLGKSDKDGRAKINSRISELQGQRIKILEANYNEELKMLKEFQDEALDLIQASETERLKSIQDLLNRQLISQEQADIARQQSTRERLAEELRLSQINEQRLAQLAATTRSPEAEIAYQSQVRAARQRTADITLKLLQEEGNRQQAYRQMAIKAIEDELAARNRSADYQLQKLREIEGARNRTARAAEAASQREINALDGVNKSLERQIALTTAQNNLQSAKNAAATSEAQLELQKTDRLLEIQRRLRTEENLSAEERAILQREEADLSQGNLSLMERRFRAQEQIREVAKQNLEFEQAQAKQSLEWEIQKQDLTNKRLVLETRIAEVKAKQAVLDGQAALNQQRLVDGKQIQQAKTELVKAQQLAPGGQRDRAVADAAAALDRTQAEAIQNQANLQQNIDLSRQQVQFATEAVKQATLQQEQQSKLNELSRETLQIQQDTATKQLEAAQNAERYAQALERAKLAAEGILDTNQYTTTPVISSPTRFDVFQGLPRRAGGGNVRSGQAYLVGENSPEVFMPGVNGTILNRQQVIQNLSVLGKVAQLPATSQTQTPNSQLLTAIQGLQSTIQSRNPTLQQNVQFGASDSAAWDDYLKFQRSMMRGGF